MGFDQLLILDKKWINVPIHLTLTWCVVYFIYRVANRLKIVLVEPNHNYNQPIIIHQEIIRIPLEDRVDLEIEDHHNVHNKTIKRTALMAIDALKYYDQHKYSISTTINEIFETIGLALKNQETQEHQENQTSPNPDQDSGSMDSFEMKINKEIIDVSPDKLKTARNVLNQINEMNSLYDTAKIPELEILRLVWERINHPVNSKCSAQLKENLIKELADCARLDGGRGLHCCEGRITRILQSLQECDSENIVNLKPMWAFKEEIENSVSKYRDKLLRRVPKKYVDLEQKMELNPEDKKLMNTFNRCLINNLEKKFQKNYIESGFLHPNELNDLTSVYYNSLYDY